MIFAKRLKYLRKEFGLTQRALGVKIGFSEDTASERMNRYEKRGIIPHYETVKKIAKAFKVPASYFYEESEQMASLILKAGKLSKSAVKRIADDIS